MHSYRSLQGSASAGVIARVLCHPLDTAKSRIQAQSTASGHSMLYRSTLHALTNTLRYEGVRGLYRGFLITLVGSVPATCLYLTSYEVRLPLYITRVITLS
jgi:hypothetical protein